MSNGDVRGRLVGVDSVKLLVKKNIVQSLVRVKHLDVDTALTGPVDSIHDVEVRCDAGAAAK